MITDTLVTSAPFDLTASVARYTRWGRDVVNVVEGGSFYRVISTEPRSTYRASQTGPREMAVEALDGRTASVATGEMRHRLSEGLSIEALDRLASQDQRIARLTAKHAGYRPPMVSDAFESLITSITAQQVNLRWATTTRNRIVERFGEPHRHRGITVWAFPRPERLAEAGAHQVAELQLTQRKSEYIIGVARAATDGYLDGIQEMSNEAVIRHLMKLRGVGRWTVDWLLARCLARPDAVAAGDLGVRKAVSRIYLGDDELAPEDQVRAITEQWGDAANWAVHLLLEELAAR